MDPHAKRVVRWFGDPNYEENLDGDDYFSRQDLDIDLRENSLKNNIINIDLVNKFAPRSKKQHYLSFFSPLKNKTPRP